MSSLDTLLSFVSHQNKDLKRRHSLSLEEVPRVKVGCGHLTFDADAEQMVFEVRALFRKIIAGKVAVTGSGEKRGVIYDYWLEGEDARYSVVAPRRLAEEARRYFQAQVRQKE